MVAPQPFVEESSSEDDSSSVATDWTVASSVGEEYAVEAILAEQERPDGMYYLVKWEGYPLDRANWEPAEHLLDRRTLTDWEETKRRNAENFVEMFDVEKWEANQAEIAAQTARRHEKRRKKRRLRNLPEEDESDEEDDEPLITSIRRQYREEPDSELHRERIGVANRKQLQPSQAAEKIPISSKDTRAVQAVKVFKGNKAMNQKDQRDKRFQRQRPLASNTAKLAERKSFTTLSTPLEPRIPKPMGRMANKGPPKKQGAELFRNWNAPQPKRKRQLADDGTLRLYNNVSHRWNVEKSGREGAAPSADALPLFDPSRGLSNVGVIRSPTEQEKMDEAKKSKEPSSNASTSAPTAVPTLASPRPHPH